MSGPGPYEVPCSPDFDDVDDEDLYAQVRTVLSYLPSNVDEEPPFFGIEDPPERSCEDLLAIVPDNRRFPKT